MKYETLFSNFPARLHGRRNGRESGRKGRIVKSTAGRRKRLGFIEIFLAIPSIFKFTLFTMKTFTESQREKAHAAILARINVPEEIKFYVGAANNDLFFGPRDSFEDDAFPWNGFQDAIRKIRQWSDHECFNSLFWDTQCEEILTKLPETEEIDGEIFEPCYEDFVEYEGADILEIVCGKELASYV